MIERDPQTGRYFTGLPCKNGHVSERFLNTRMCVECNRERNRLNYAQSREKQSARALEYYWANKDARCEYGKQNRDKTRRAVSKWARANLEAIRAIKNRCRARKTAAGGSYTAEDAAAIFKAQRGRCAYCRAKLSRKTRHLDHIFPIALGGDNNRENLQFLCQPCNSSKSARHPIDFARSRGMLL